MESAFGSDFSDVRVHTGPQALELNDRIQARAFTVGQDVYFRDGLPDTRSADGQHLLAHELAHTIQQTGNQRGRAQRSDRSTIQRDGTAKAAHDALVLLLEQAKALAEEAATDGVTAVRAAELQAAIDRIVVTADGHRSDAAEASDYQNYRRYIPTLADQIRARQTAIGRRCAVLVKAGAVEQVKDMLSKLRVQTPVWVAACQSGADVVIEQLNRACAAGTSDLASDAAESATKAEAKLTSGVAKLTTNFDKAIRTVEAAVAVAAGSDDGRWSEATDPRNEVVDGIDLLRMIFAMIVADARRARFGADAVTDALRVAEQARESSAAKTVLAAKATSDVHAAKAALDEAIERAEESTRIAVEAERVTDDALRQADDAQRRVVEAEQASAEARERAVALSSALHRYERHLNRAPSADAVKMFDERRATASEASNEASLLEEASAASKLTAEEKRAAADSTREMSERNRSTATEAREEQDESMAAHAAKHKEFEGATAAEAEAANTLVVADAARDKEVVDQTSFTRERADLAVLLPDPLERAQVRLAFNDNIPAVLALAGGGATRSTLLDEGATIARMLTLWTQPETSTVVARCQVLDLVADGRLTLFLTNALPGAELSAARAIELLDCVGGTAAWFCNDGVAGAKRLLVTGWSAAQTKPVVKAAEETAKLTAPSLAKVVKLVEDVGLPHADCRLLLESEVTATFLTSTAMSSIRRLLTAGWAVSKIVLLIKAAATLSKPSKAELESYCALVCVPTITVDNAVRIMQSAKCTAKYLVDSAFTCLHDAVVAGWSTGDIKSFVAAAETKAKLTKAQLDRLYLLCATNMFTAASATNCLKSSGIDDWDAVMNEIDNFVAAGNKHTPAGIAGDHTRTRNVGPDGDRIRLGVDSARVGHFMSGHSYAHYQFTLANIERGDGNQPSSMWPLGTTPAQVRDSAVAAFLVADVEAVARRAFTAAGFRQEDFAGYCVGFQKFDISATVKLMQFFPLGLASASIPPSVMKAIGRLFGAF